MRLHRIFSQQCNDTVKVQNLNRVWLSVAAEILLCESIIE